MTAACAEDVRQEWLHAIETELDQAQRSFTGQAQRDVQAARAALRNRDLAAARALLSAAISDAQAGR